MFAAVTTMPVPTLAALKLASWLSVTLSDPITPTKDPPEILATVVPSYTLSAATVTPPTVNALALRVATFLILLEEAL